MTSFPIKCNDISLRLFNFNDTFPIRRYFFDLVISLNIIQNMGSIKILIIGYFLIKYGYLMLLIIIKITIAVLDSLFIISQE